MIRRRLVVTGRVQNVFYRDWLVERMRGLGVRGWVRNRADNSVEAVVEGTSEQVEAAIALARQGSPASRVAEVTVSEDAPTETLEGFAKRATL
jgi:acylphosphatase